MVKNVLNRMILALAVVTTVLAGMAYYIPSALFYDMSSYNGSIILVGIYAYLSLIHLANIYEKSERNKWTKP